MQNRRPHVGTMPLDQPTAQFDLTLLMARGWGRTGRFDAVQLDLFDAARSHEWPAFRGLARRLVSHPEKQSRSYNFSHRVTKTTLKRLERYETEYRGRICLHASLRRRRSNARPITLPWSSRSRIHVRRSKSPRQPTSSLFEEAGCWTRNLCRHLPGAFAGNGCGSCSAYSKPVTELIYPWIRVSTRSPGFHAG